MAFIGPQKGGPFDVGAELAMRWLKLPNPSGVSNADVLHPYVNGIDLLRNNRHRWMIDFNRMDEAAARRYVLPFAYVEEHVLPIRLKTARESRRLFWWRHHETAAEFREALGNQRRYLATPAVSKHRVWQWLDASVYPDKALVVIASEDDFMFGVVHSSIHEVWALRQGTSLEDRPRYTPSTCFETFAFPEATNTDRAAVIEAASHVDAVRSHLLGSDGALTMTKLYNEVSVLRHQRDVSARAFPLLLAHEALNEAVADAYGWEWPLTDDEILQRLLRLNLERSDAKRA